MIGTRTKAALVAAKARGVKLGGPKLAQARKVALETIGAAADSHAANVPRKRRDPFIWNVTSVWYICAPCSWATTTRDILYRERRT